MCGFSTSAVDVEPAHPLGLGGSSCVQWDAGQHCDLCLPNAVPLAAPALMGTKNVQTSPSGREGANKTVQE